MLIKDESFRNLYHALVILKSKKYVQLTSKLLNKSQKDNNVNSLLLYPYINHEVGMLFLVLGLVKLFDNRAEIINRDDFNINKSIKKRNLNNNEFAYVNDVNINADFKLTHHLNHARHITKTFSKNVQLECIRQARSLDKFRDINNPDIVSVLFLKDKLKPEYLNVCLENISDGFFNGVLLDNPQQNFGVLKGMDVNVYLKRNDENRIICYSKL